VPRRGWRTEMMAYRENLTSARTIITASRVLSADDIATFSTLTCDRSPVHRDAEFAKRSPFRGIVAHGTLVLAIAQGLMVSSGVFQDSIAFLGLTWRMREAVRPGDTLHVEVAVKSRCISRTDQAREIVEFGFYVINQLATTVGEGSWTQLFATQSVANTTSEQ
jgi:acyl dehydratase